MGSQHIALASWSVREMKRAINQVINQIRRPISPLPLSSDDRFCARQLDFWATCPLPRPLFRTADAGHRLFVPLDSPGGVDFVSLAANYAARRGHRSKIRMQEQLGRIPICDSYFLQSSIWSLICLASRFSLLTPHSSLLAFPFLHFFFSTYFVWPVLILGCNVCIWDFRPRKGGGRYSIVYAQLSHHDGWMVVDWYSILQGP